MGTRNCRQVSLRLDHVTATGEDAIASLTHDLLAHLTRFVVRKPCFGVMTATDAAYDGFRITACHPSLRDTCARYSGRAVMAGTQATTVLEYSVEKFA